MAMNTMLPPLIETLMVSGIEVGLTQQEDTEFLPKSVQENIGGLFAFKIDGFYKHGQAHMVLNDDDKSYTVYGRYGKLSGDVRTLEDLIVLNYHEWTRWGSVEEWSTVDSTWLISMQLHNNKIKNDPDIADSFLLDLTPYSDEEVDTGTCVGHTDEPAWVLK